MRRRTALAVPLLLAGCGLAERPYVARRDWAFDIRRPATLPPPQTHLARGPVLLVRDLAAGPGMEARGLQARLPDGQVQVAFYDRWAVPPAEGVSDALRAWLLASGKFAAVIGPASLANPDLVLEGEVQSLYVEGTTARAVLGMRLLDLHGGPPRIRLQRSIAASAPVVGQGPAAQVAAMNAALAQVFAAIEAAA